MEPDPSVAEEMHRRARMNDPYNRRFIKDPDILDVYHEVRIIRKWVVFIGIVVIIGLIGGGISLFG